MLFYESINSLLVEVGEDLDIFLSIVITYVQPELVESVRSSTITIQPDVTTLCLTKLLAICLGNQRTSEAEALCIIAESTMNQLSTCSHVTPLVVTTELKAHTILFILIKEVVTLKQLISKLSERQAVTSLTIQTLLYTILCHHIVNGNVLTYHTSEIEESKVLHPVVVVYQLGLIWLIAIEVKELRYLLLDSLLVMIESLCVEKITLLALARRVANHTCSTANKQIRLVTTTLQVTQHHDSTKVTDMKRVCGRVSTKISRHHVGVEVFLCTWHNLSQHTTPFQFFNKVFCHRMRLLYII